MKSFNETVTDFCLVLALAIIFVGLIFYLNGNKIRITVDPDKCADITQCTKACGNNPIVIAKSNGVWKCACDL